MGKIQKQKKIEFLQGDGNDKHVIVPPNISLWERENYDIVFKCYSNVKEVIT